MTDTDVLDDLEAEQDHLEAVLADLSDAQWRAASAAKGWSVADVVLHLAQTEEAVVASTEGRNLADVIPIEGASVDEVMDNAVRMQRAEPEVIFERWRAARRAALAGLRKADPGTGLPWVAAPLKPKAMATTRLAEHWAHALDVTEPFGIAYPDTPRLRHIAWLAHRTLPYSYMVAGAEPFDVYVRLTAPDGVATWEFGSPDAGTTVTGPAGDFCRVAAQRMTPEGSGLTATGPGAAVTLQVLRTYAA